ncbi:MAG: baseplate J/gp47 family protein [Cyclobacteriaceae bacterium]
MIDLKNIHQFLRSTDGVNQLQRNLPALDPTYVQLDGRTKSDLINFLYKLSNQISYYNQINIPQGDWTAFFDFLKSADGSIMSDDELDQLMASRNDWPPHLALLMAFLGLYAVAQQDMNLLVGKHLNYFYKKVLQVTPRIARPDQVHVTFELNKLETSYLLSQGTLLDAGKDSSGQPLRYSLDNDMVINRSVVQSLKSLYFDQQNGRAIVFIADDATLVKSSLSSGWRPFGTSQLAMAREVRNMVEANLGFAIASPALLLAEGTRSITITIHLTATPGFSTDDLPSFLPACFDISLTGDKGWTFPLFIQSYANDSDNLNLKLTTNLNEKDAPVVSYNSKLHGDGYTTAWPVLRGVLKPYSFQLETLAKFVVSNIEIEVIADGIKNLVLQNDESLQPVNKPILPFTSFPRIGNNFYIGSTEAFSKSLQSVSVALNWKDPPANFKDYYIGYDNAQINYSEFQHSTSILAEANWKILTPGAQPLFDGNNTSDPKIFTEDVSLTQEAAYSRNPNLIPVKEYSPGVDQGFISIQLSAPRQGDVGNLPSYAPFEAFGHKVFPSIYAVKAVKRSASPDDDTILFPNQPYTPTLQSVTLDYKAKETFTPSIPNQIDQFFMLDAFGNVECNANIPARLIPELPVSAATLTGTQVGVLYLGIDKSQLPQILSLLFQMESGSMPGSLLLQKDDISWSYLKDNEWQPIASPDIQRDTTESFQMPGIIQVSLASDADLAATLMPSGLCWLRVTAYQNADGASDISTIKAQAASATMIAGDDADISTLQPGTITKLVTKTSAIKTVTQNYPSFNGLATESDADFYVRTSERLRHRNRTITGWDYERIVLQEFPGLFKAKCLSHTNYIDDFNNLEPGCIKLVVIPDVRQGNAGNLLQPMCNLAYLDEIKQFVIEENPSPFLNTDTVFVSNPFYETLLVDCKISFITGYDPGYYSNQLQNDISRFLSPWAYDEGQDITFGGKIYASEILSFIESRSYINYVIDFRLYHRSQGKDFTSGIGCMKIGTDFIVGIQPSATIASSDGYTFTGTKIGFDFVVGIPVDVATATRADAILASNISHRIGTLQEGSFECSGKTSLGIGEMIVGLDLIPI